MIKSLKAMTLPISGPLRLLLLDDHPADAELSLLELQRAGYQVNAEITQNLEEFSARLRTNFYDLVISDYNLGASTGMDALTVLKDMQKDIPFVLVSGSLGDEQAVDCVKLGATDFVLKDNLVRLPLAVRRALAERGLRAEQGLAQQALRQSEERYRRLVEASPDAILVNCEGRIVFANPAAQHMLGAAHPEQLLGVPMLQVIHADYHPVVHQRMRLSLEQKLAAPALEEKFLRLDGLPVEVEVIAIPFRWQDKDAVQVVMRDISERKRAQEAVRRSETRFRRVFDTNVMGVIICTLEGAVLDANDAFLNLVGYSRQELEAGQIRWTELTPPEFLHLDEQASEQLRLGQAVPPWEKEYIRKDGARVPVLIGAAMLEGSREEAVGFILDIGERKREQEALRQSEEKFAKAFDSSPTAISISTLSEGRYVDVNDAFLQMTGYKRPEILGRTAAELGMWIHPEVRTALVEALHTQGRVLDFEFLFRSKNGEDRCGLLSGEIIQVGGEPCLLANVRDDTERRRAERALRESQRQYESLVNSVDGIVWEADSRTLRFTFVSRQAERLLGYPAAQWLEEPDFWPGHIHVEDRQWVVEECLRATAEQRDHSFEYRMLSADGRTVWLRDMVNVVTENGQPSKLRGLMVDVSQQREMEAQLRQAQKMEAVGQLAGGVAHDFNNLLMVIRGYCELMLDRLEPNSVIRTQAEGIMQAAQRASTVTRQLLAFSRKQVLQPRVLDLNTVVEDVSQMLMRLIGEDIDLDVIKTPGLGRVKADPGQVEQVIVNMAVNARDAMPGGGKLTIETRNVELDNSYARHHISVQPGPYVLLAVTDNGTGMDAETRSRVFEPFFTTKEQGKGTGLGLATVYGIVKQSGGYVWVYSEPGQGTTFKVYLPRVFDAAESAAATGAGKKPVLATETVLLVEDEEGVRTVVRGFLEARGYRVLEASDGPEAIHLANIQNGPIHLLLTDMVMPSMNGPELAEEVIQAQPSIKVVYMSGYTPGGARHNHDLDVQAAFLEKPFSGETLSNKLREVLDARPRR